MSYVPLGPRRGSGTVTGCKEVDSNAVYPCVDDVLELIYQGRLNNARITCAADYMFQDELVRPSSLILFVGEKEARDNR